MKYLGLLLLASCGIAFASGDEIEQEQDLINTIGGNSSKTFAVGNTLGDVDIAQCMGSTQWNSPVYGKQKLVLNHACMAEFYLKNKRYGLAAQSLCNIPEELAEYPDETSCEEAHDFTPTYVEAPAEATYDVSDEIEEEIQIAQMQHVEDVTSLDERLERLESGRRAAQRRAAEEAEYKADLIQRIQGIDEDESED